MGSPIQDNSENDSLKISQLCDKKKFLINHLPKASKFHRDQRQQFSNDGKKKKKRSY